MRKVRRSPIDILVSEVMSFPSKRAENSCATNNRARLHKNDLAEIYEIKHSECVNHGPPGEFKGPGQIAMQGRSAFSDIHNDIVEVLREGEGLAAR